MRKMPCLLSVCLLAAGVAQAALLVGWEEATANAISKTSGFTGTAAPSTASGTVLGWGISSNANQLDQLGVYANGDVAPSAGNTWKSGSTVTLADTAYMDFTINNGSGSAVKLGSFMFDGVLRKPGGMKDWTVSVVSGDLTAGVVASGTLPAAAKASALGAEYEGFLVSLTGLADSELDIGGSAIFRVTYSGATVLQAADESYIDNVGIAAIPEPATLGLVAAAGVGVIFIRRRVMM